MSDMANRIAARHKQAIYNDQTLEVLMAGLGMVVTQAIVVSNSFFDEKEIRKYLSLRRQFHDQYAQACNDLADAFERGDFGASVGPAVQPLRNISRLGPKQDRLALRQLTRLLRTLYPHRSHITGDPNIQRLISYARNLSVGEVSDHAFNDFLSRLIRTQVLPAPMRTMFRRLQKLKGFTKPDETANPGAWFDMTDPQKKQIRETAQRLVKEKDEAYETHKDDPQRRIEVWERTIHQLQKLQNAAGVNLQIITKQDEEPLETVLKREQKLQMDGPTEYMVGKVNQMVVQLGMRDRKQGEPLPREVGKVLTQISKAKTFGTVERIVRDAVSRQLFPNYTLEGLESYAGQMRKNRAVREGRSLVPLQWSPKTVEEFQSDHQTGKVRFPEEMPEDRQKELLGRVGRAIEDLEGVFGKGFCGKHAKKLEFSFAGDMVGSTAAASYFTWNDKQVWQPRVTFGDDFDGLLAHELSHYFDDLLYHKIDEQYRKDRGEPPPKSFGGSAGGNIFGNTGVSLEWFASQDRPYLTNYLPEVMEFAKAVLSTPDYQRWKDKLTSAHDSFIPIAIKELAGQDVYSLPKDHPYIKALDAKYRSDLPPELLQKTEELYTRSMDGDKRKLTYYDSGGEVWARMCEQYVYTKLSKVGVANPWLTQLTYDIDVMDQFMDEKTFDELMVPIMDRLFQSIGVRNIMASRVLSRYVVGV